MREAEASIRGRAFAFKRDSGAKVDSFMSWLNEMEEKTVLEITRRPGTIRGMEEAWTDTYIQTTYQKSIIKERQKLLKAGVDVSPLESAEGMTGAFNSPFHADRVAILYQRTFNELKGVTKAMDQQISRLLAQGMAEGRNPRVIAGWIKKQIGLPAIGVKLPSGGVRTISSITRAKMIAQTEITRANGQAAIAEYKRVEATGVKVKAEWETGGAACETCAALGGRVFDLDYIQGIHPAHPNCLISSRVNIFTSKGWKGIGKIKVGDLVLTHKRRFRKVTQLHRNSEQIPSVTKIGFDKNKKFLTLTDNHPILISGKWKEAKDIEKGNQLYFLANACIRCDKLIPYFKQYCSYSCNSKDITDRQWSNPEHISEKRIKKDLKGIYQELSRVFMNHKGMYRFMDMEVTSVKRWKVLKPRMLYNLSVEEDESYIACGASIHNCRCNILPVVGPDIAKARREGRIIDTKGRAVKPKSIKRKSKS